MIITKYIVNEKCIGCGLYEETCPEVFTMTNEGVAKAVETEVPTELDTVTAKANDGYPVDAIKEA